jgi:hypothetical protein
VLKRMAKDFHGFNYYVMVFWNVLVEIEEGTAAQFMARTWRVSRSSLFPKRASSLDPMEVPSVVTKKDWLLVS